MEKFHREWRFQAARVRNAALRQVLLPLAHWRPLEQALPGYSVIVGCSVDLVSILRANLQLLARQHRDHLERVILVFDRRAEDARPKVEPEIREQFGSRLPIEFVYYNHAQDWAMRALDWGWTYCWLNWVLGVAACRTRYAVIHDLDAMLLRPDLIEKQYLAARDASAAFCGTSYYHCNGIEEDDHLLTTFEMICDVERLRARCRPIDLFNLPARWKGRRIEFDTFLWPQARPDAPGLLRPIDPRDMVHPSQMICQYTFVRGRDGYVPPANNNILMLPYFMELGGDGRTMRQQRAAIDRADGSLLECFGRPVDFAKFTPTHAAWLKEQGLRLDAAVHGEVRPQVRDYFDAVAGFAERVAGQDQQATPTGTAAARPVGSQGGHAAGFASGAPGGSRHVAARG